MLGMIWWLTAVPGQPQELDGYGCSWSPEEQQIQRQAVLFWEKLPLESGTDFPAQHSLLRTGGGVAGGSDSRDGAVAMGALCLLWLSF